MPTPEVKGFKDRNTGTTYALNDETARAGVADSLHLSAQELTSTQKAQVFENIGLVIDEDLDTEGAAADSKATGDALALKIPKSDIDTTLATSGKVADAKATGDAIAAAAADAKGALYATVPPMLVQGYLYTGTVGEKYNITVTASWRGAKIVKANGKKLKVTYGTPSDNTSRSYILLCKADGEVVSVVTGKYNARHIETAYIECTGDVDMVLINGYVAAQLWNDPVTALWTDVSECATALTRGEIILPALIPVAVGREANLYWSSIANVAEGDKGVYFEVSCDIGGNAERCFTVTPAAGDIGTHALTIVARDTYTREVLSTYTGNIVVIAADGGSGEKNLLMMGDSRTLISTNDAQGESYSTASNETVTATLLGLLNGNQGAEFACVGSVVSAADTDVKNLSVSGWKTTDAITYITGQGGLVDYVETTCGMGEGAALDYVTIMFGVNDVANWNSNATDQYTTAVGKMNAAVYYSKGLVDLIHAAYSSCKVLVVLEPTTCASQDGFGLTQNNNNTLRQANNELEQAMKLLRKLLIEAYSASTYSFVTVCPAGLMCDRLWGFPYINQKPATRVSAMDVPVFVENVHPHNDGLKQIADGIFSTIKYLESLS